MSTPESAKRIALKAVGPGGPGHARAIRRAFIALAIGGEATLTITTFAWYYLIVRTAGLGGLSAWVTVFLAVFALIWGIAMIRLLSRPEPWIP